MLTLSALAGRKGVCLAATFSVYTFALTYLYSYVDHGRYRMKSSSEPSSTFGTQFNDVITLMSNSSRLAIAEAPIWKLSVISPIQNAYQKHSQQIMSIKLKVKHTPKKDNSQMEISKDLYEKIRYFREKLKETEVRLLRRTIEVFDFVMTKNKIDYLMYGGTLIGSYRHHGLVPWDDDLDVLVPLSAQSSLYNAFNNFSEEFILNNDWAFSWKLYSVKGDPIRGYNWCWPYLDIFFYTENETHIWDVAPQYSNSFVYLKNNIFPLKRRPFMNLLLLAPYNPRSVIDTNYDVSLCNSGKWIHKWERHGIETSVPCYLLYLKFPFVRRTLQHSGCNESLIHNGTVMSYFVNVDMPC